MDKIKFLIVLFVATMVAQGVMAVTLPSTSYSPYVDDCSYSSDVVVGTGTSITGSFASLGDGEDEKYKTECAPTDPPSGITTKGEMCEECCAKWTQYGTQARIDCNYECNHGPALPISTPLWFALLLPLFAGALKPLLSHKKDL